MGYHLSSCSNQNLKPYSHTLTKLLSSVPWNSTSSPHLNSLLLILTSITHPSSNNEGMPPELEIRSCHMPYWKNFPGSPLKFEWNANFSLWPLFHYRHFEPLPHYLASNKLCPPLPRTLYLQSSLAGSSSSSWFLLPFSGLNFISPPDQGFLLWSFCQLLHFHLLMFALCI